MLDNSCLMFLSNMWSGSRHDSSKLPVCITRWTWRHDSQPGVSWTILIVPKMNASCAACIFACWTEWVRPNPRLAMLRRS